MNVNNEKLLEVIRAQTAITKTPKKVLAFKCGVSRSSFSQYINGDVEMPQEVKAKLIEVLGLQPYVEKLEL